VAGGRDVTDIFLQRAKGKMRIRKNIYISIQCIGLRLRALADLGKISALGEVITGGMFSSLLSSSMSKVVRVR